MRSVPTWILIFAFALAVEQGWADPTPDPSPEAEPTEVSAVRHAVELLRPIAARWDSAHVVEQLLTSLVNAADPGGAVVTDPETFERQRSGHQFGLGYTAVFSNRQTIVCDVWPGGPADGQLCPGDMLDRIADRFVTGFSPAQQAEWIAGIQGPVTVTVARVGERDIRSFVLRPAWARPPAVEQHTVLPGGIHWLRLRGVWTGAYEAVQRCWTAPATGRMAGVVLDLRDAGGTDLGEVVRIGSIGQSESQELFELRPTAEGTPRRFVSQPSSLKPAVPMVVLVGPGTRGAAEVLAHVMRAGPYRVVVVGQPTRGDPMIREVVPVQPPWHVYVTRWSLVVRGLHSSGPVQPDLVVAEGPSRTNGSLAHRSEPPLNPKRRASAEEQEDEALRRRVSDDAPLQAAVDLLIAVRALDLHSRP